MTDLAAAVMSAVPQTQVDVLGRPQTLVVPDDHWRVAAAALRDAGGNRCEWLTAADLPSGLRIAMLITGRSESIVLTTSPQNSALQSVSDIWASARWQERECAELFGVDFRGHPGLTPLLLRLTPVWAPLRRTFPLEARRGRSWPGEHAATGPAVAADSGRPAQGRRAVGPAPGVLPTWEKGASDDHA